MTDRNGTSLGISHFTSQEKGKVLGEEQNQKMSVFCSVSISKPAGGQAPIFLTGFGLSYNLSCDVLLNGSLDAAIIAITGGWALWSPE